VSIEQGCHTLKCPFSRPYLLEIGTLSVYRARLSYTGMPYIQYIMENSTVSVYQARLSYTEVPYSVYTGKWFCQRISS